MQKTLVLASILVFGFGGIARAAQAGGPTPKATVSDTPEAVSLNLGSATLSIQKSPWHLAMTSAAGAAQMEEADAPAFRVNGQWNPVKRVTSVRQQPGGTLELALELSNGSSASARVEPLSPFAARVTLTANAATVEAIRGANKLAASEEVYGFGEMWNGHVAQRGQEFDVWDKNGTPDECAYMPYYVTTQNYAWFLNYGGRVHFDVGKAQADRLTYEAPSSRFEMTLFSGRSLAEAVDHFQGLTGRPRIPPRWAFMPWFWLQAPPDDPYGSSYTGAGALVAARRYKALDIPAGVTWFEPRWETARNSFDPSPEFSPDFPALIKQLEALGLRVLAWSTPYTNPDSPNYATAVKNGYLVGKPSKVPDLDAKNRLGYRYIDFLNPAAREWWQGEIAKGIKAGLHGFKLDAGQDLPDDVELYGGVKGKDAHNSFAYYYNLTYSEVLRKYYGDDFMMIPRSAWVGSNSLTNFKWPGDLAASFNANGISSTVYSSLSLAFSGIPFLSTDIGAYVRLSPEHIWVRWAQIGALLPGMQTLSMPWWFSKHAQDHYRYLSWLHTELIPLWMTLAHEAHDQSAPVIRPLVWTFQDDKESWRVDDEFTVGNALLAAPVLQLLDNRKVYFPSGRWFDFWDDSKVVDGPSTQMWKGDLWHMPLYVREGAIIPMEVKNHVTGFGWAESEPFITMALWPKASGSSTFTLHDREAPVTFTATSSQQDVSDVKWTESGKDYIFRIHVAQTPPTQVSVIKDGQPVALERTPSALAFRTAAGQDWFYDDAGHKLYVRTLAKENSRELRIQR
ncbi:MAG TPA: TIM-barrel domain-containing protein [Bryobacteraceae bacterium]|nr:TIM-barrel domain-containing protein [Bryobacteraceae bacterium]